MRPLHAQEKEQFRKLFMQVNVDQFEDRFKILEVFLTTERHLTVDETSNLLADHGHSYSPAFIIETLKLMCDYGFAQKNRFKNGDVRYEHRHPCHHHDHMICTKCGRIIEFENDQMERLQIQIVKHHRFHILQHKMEIYGICEDCMRTQSENMPLTIARPGDRVLVKTIQGGRMVETRLSAMGLRVGDSVEIITRQTKGQMVVSIDCKRYILGRGLAQKIFVEYDQAFPEYKSGTCQGEIENTPTPLNMPD